MDKWILSLTVAAAASTSLAGCAGMTGTDRGAPPQAAVEPHEGGIQRGFGAAVRGDELYGAWDVNDDGLIDRQEFAAAGIDDDFAAWDLDDDLAIDEEEFRSAALERGEAAGRQTSRRPE